MVLVATAAASPARAEPCHEGDVEIRRERDFRLLAGITCLRGSLEISDDVSSLARLKALETIEGDLEIVHSDHLTSLRGFDALTHVTGADAVDDLRVVGLARRDPGNRQGRQRHDRPRAGARDAPAACRLKPSVTFTSSKR